MKKIYSLCAWLQLIFCVMPLVGMNSYDDDPMIRFNGGHSIISVKKSHVQQMQYLNYYYQKHKSIADKGGIIPEQPYVSPQAITLVTDALDARVDTFADYYKKLSAKEKALLVKVTGTYDHCGRQIMLDVPKITRRLVDICLSYDVKKHVKKKYGDDRDIRYVDNYFKGRLITSKRLFSLKQDVESKPTVDALRTDIYLGSVFINSLHTIKQHKYPILLPVKDVQHKTYATHFGNNNYEYRVTDIIGKKGVIRVINHATGESYSCDIEHASDIKGCCISNTGTNCECVVTYSSDDVVFTTLTAHDKGVNCKSIFHTFKEKGEIVDVCYDSFDDNFFVGVNRTFDSIIKRHSADGTYQIDYLLGTFKKYGFLESVISFPCESYCYMVAIRGVGCQHRLDSFESTENNTFKSLFNTLLLTMKDFNDEVVSWRMVDTGNDVFLFYPKIPLLVDRDPFRCTDSLLIDISNAFAHEVNSDMHRVYSPDGSMIMCNSLKNDKLGFIYIETEIKDAVTHQPIIALSTRRNSILGMGFSHDSSELIFFDEYTTLDKAVLLAENDKVMLKDIADLAYGNSGVVELLKELCDECKKNGIIKVCKNSSTYQMLIEWARKSPTMCAFLKTCLPIKLITDNDYNLINFSKFLLGPAKSNLSSSLTT
jgi:hypothetical protein